VIPDTDRAVLDGGIEMIASDSTANYFVVSGIAQCYSSLVRLPLPHPATYFVYVLLRKEKGENHDELFPTSNSAGGR